MPGVLERAVEEYEAAGGDGYNDSLETEDSLDATSGQRAGMKFCMTA